MPHPNALGEGATSPAGRGAVRVDRCICRDRPFADLLPQARHHGWDLAALMGATGCGAQCGLCRPYLRRMLETGETLFHELLPVEPA